MIKKILAFSSILGLVSCCFVFAQDTVVSMSATPTALIGISISPDAAMNFGPFSNNSPISSASKGETATLTNTGNVPIDVSVIGDANAVNTVDPDIKWQLYVNNDGSFFRLASKWNGGTEVFYGVDTSTPPYNPVYVQIGSLAVAASTPWDCVFYPPASPGTFGSAFTWNSTLLAVEQ